MARQNAVAVVAEDQEFWRSGISSMLRRQLGFGKVVQTINFEQLLQALEAEPDPALVTIDLELPGLQRHLGLREVRTRYPSARVVVITAQADRETILLSLSAGSHGFIPKRMQAAEIQAALALVMDGCIFVPPDFPELPEGQEVHPASLSVASLTGSLTDRQREVLTLLAEGKSNKEIARILGITEGTVKVHVNAAFRTLGVHNRVSAVVAIQAIAKAPHSS